MFPLKKYLLLLLLIQTFVISAPSVFSLHNTRLLSVSRVIISTYGYGAKNHSQTRIRATFLESSQRGIQGDNFLVSLLKYFFWNIQYAGWIGLLISSSLMFTYFTTLDEDFVVRFEKRKFTKFAMSDTSYTMTQGKGQVWAEVAREPRAVLLSSRCLSLTFPAMMLAWLWLSLLLTTAILASSPTKTPMVTCCPPGSFLAIEDSLKLRQLPNGTWGRLWTI